MPSNHEDLARMNDAAVDPSGDIVMTRSEEQLVVTARRTPVATAVLRRVVVVEQRTITIDVAHEEVRLEIVPFAEEQEEGARASHLALPEFVLSEEQVVVTKRTVPVERVRMVVDSVVTQRTITEAVERERVEVIEGEGGA